VRVILRGSCEHEPRIFFRVQRISRFFVLAWSLITQFTIRIFGRNISLTVFVSQST